MSTLSSRDVIIVLSLLAGVLRVVAPDHWLPTSVLAWQKKWRTPATIGYALFAFSSHIAAGSLLFLFFQGWMNRVGSSEVFLAGFMIMLVLAWIRRNRMPQLVEIF